MMHGHYYTMCKIDILTQTTLSILRKVREKIDFFQNLEAKM